MVVRTVGGLWEGLDPRTEEAARLLGASRWRAFREVTLPALRPAIASAAAITFLFTFTSFGVVRILGGPAHRTLEVEIYRQTADLLDLPVASVLALLQLAAVGGHARRPGPRWSGGAAAAAVALRPAAAPAAPHDRRAVRGSAPTSLLLGVLLGLPLAVLVERSFRTGDGHGLAGWRALPGRPARSGLFVPPLEAVGNSLRFAVVATVIAVVLGGLAAAALTRLPEPRWPEPSTACCCSRSASQR